METYEIFKFLHISSAIIWVGGGVFSAVLLERAKSADGTHRLGIVQDLAFASNRVFAPAAIATLLFGVLMVLDAEAIEFQQTWIVIGLGAVAASIVLGAGFLGPQSEKLVGDLQFNDAGALDRMRRIAIVSYVDLAVLLVAIWAMVTKPGLV